MVNAKKYILMFSVEYCGDAYSACEGSDCIVIVLNGRILPDWIFFKLKSVVRNPALWIWEIYMSLTM